MLLACQTPSEPVEVTSLLGTIRGGEQIEAHWAVDYCGNVPPDWLEEIESEVVRGVEKAITDSAVDRSNAESVSFDGFSFSFGYAAGSICGQILPKRRLIQTACNCECVDGQCRSPFDYIGWEARNWACWVTRECVAI